MQAVLIAYHGLALLSLFFAFNSRDPDKGIKGSGAFSIDDLCNGDHVHIKMQLHHASLKCSDMIAVIGHTTIVTCTSHRW